MNGDEAFNLLWELVSLKIAQPSVIVMENNESGSFNLKVATHQDVNGLRSFVSDKHLSLREDKEKGTCIIYRSHLEVNGDVNGFRQ